MAKNETTQTIGERAGQQQRWDDPVLMVIDTGPTPGVGNNANRFTPPIDCVVQIESWGFVITEDVGDATNNAVVDIQAVENGVAVAAFDTIDIETVGGYTNGVLTAGAIWEFNTDGTFCNGVEVLNTGVVVSPFAPFFLDAAQGDYACFGISVLAGGGGVTTGQLYFFLRYRFLVAPEQDFNESGYL